MEWGDGKDSWQSACPGAVEAPFGERSEPRRGLSLSQQRVYPLIPRYRPASSLSLLYLALAPAADVLYLSSRMNG